MRILSSITAGAAVIAATMVVSARAETPVRLLNMSGASHGDQVHLVAERGDGGRRGGQGDGGNWSRGDRGGGGGWSGGWDGGRNRGGWDSGWGRSGWGRSGWDSGWGRSGFYLGLSPYGYGYGYGYPGYSYGGYSRPYYGYNYGYSTPSYGYSYSQPSYSYDYSQPSYSYDGGYTTGYWQGPAANPAATTEPIRSRVVNPADNQATLRYSVNGRQYSIRPGEQHDFTEPGPGVIEFDRGNNAGFAQYRLSGGVYTFSPTDRGWELFRSQGDIATAQ